MRIYEKATTDLGDPIKGRMVLFVPKSGVADDGCILNFSLAYPSKTVTETGYTFVIDAEDEDKLPKCKIQNGALVYEN